jgi:hypothetical protein
MPNITTTSPRLGLTKNLHDKNTVESSVIDYSGDAVNPKYYYDTDSSHVETSSPAGYVNVQNFLTDEVVMARGDYVL